MSRNRAAIMGNVPSVPRFRFRPQVSPHKRYLAAQYDEQRKLMLYEVRRPDYALVKLFSIASDHWDA